MRLTITLKLAGAFAAVVALTALIGVLSITRAASLKDDTVQLGERLVPAAETVGLLKEETGKYRRNQLIFATGAQDLDDVQAELDGSLEALPPLVGTYRKLALDGNSRAALAVFEAKWKAYVEATAGMQALGRAREHSAALATLTTGDGDETWSAVKDSLVAIDEANQGAGGTRVAAATDGPTPRGP
jgi:methyl-accepting chemotaxis protein